MTTSALFTPLNIGPLTLKHRVVMAPLTRSRSEQPGDIPGDLMREYYTQRASDGGLIISEATTISRHGTRLVRSTRPLHRSAGRGLEEDCGLCPRQGWPDVLPALAHWTCVAR